MQQSQISDGIEKLAFIDALRGCAVIGVLIVHTGSLSAPPDWFRPFGSQGARGVQLFYIASTLTLFMSMSQRTNREENPIRNYFIRRFFRIAPLFYVAIIFWLFMDGFAPRYWAPNGIGMGTVVSTFLFANAWHPETITAIVPGGWSVAIEMSMYAIMPFLFRAVTTLRRAIVWWLLLSAVGIGMSLICYRLFRQLYPSEQDYLLYDYFGLLWLPAEVPVFALGMIVFFCFKNEVLLGRTKTSWLVLITSIAGMVWLAYHAFLFRHVVFGIALAGFALAIGNLRPWLFVNPVTQMLGKLSYSIYLVHFAVIACIAALWPMSPEISVAGGRGYWTVLSLVFFGAIMVSWLTYWFIEVPGQAIGRRIIRSLKVHDTNPA